MATCKQKARVLSRVQWHCLQQRWTSRYQALTWTRVGLLPDKTLLGKQFPHIIIIWILAIFMIRLQTFIANIQIIYETDLFYKDLTCCLVLTRSRGWKRSVEQVPLKMFPITISKGWQGWSYPYRLSFNLYLSDPARKAFVTGLSWDTTSILKSSLFLSILLYFFCI